MVSYLKYWKIHHFWQTFEKMLPVQKANKGLRGLRHYDLVLVSREMFSFKD